MAAKRTSATRFPPRIVDGAGGRRDNGDPRFDEQPVPDTSFADLDLRLDWDQLRPGHPAARESTRLLIACEGGELTPEELGALCERAEPMAADELISSVLSRICTSSRTGALQREHLMDKREWGAAILE